MYLCGQYELLRTKYTVPSIPAFIRAVEEVDTTSRLPWLGKMLS